jgi:hypothetical protein
VHPLGFVFLTYFASQLREAINSNAFVGKRRSNCFLDDQHGTMAEGSYPSLTWINGNNGYLYSYLRTHSYCLASDGAWYPT